MLVEARCWRPSRTRAEVSRASSASSSAAGAAAGATSGGRRCGTDALLTLRGTDSTTMQSPGREGAAGPHAHCNVPRGCDRKLGRAGAADRAYLATEQPIAARSRAGGSDRRQGLIYRRRDDPLGEREMLARADDLTSLTLSPRCGEP